MRRASVSKLKASLSSFVRHVKAGEDILVTERGRPVAMLVPVESPADLPDRLRDLERDGKIKLGTGKLPPAFWRLARPKDPDALIRRAVREERENSR